MGTTGHSAHPSLARHPHYGGAAGTWHGATQRLTPRRTCPRPIGLGRNLRSKTRWFAGFCNSHHVSHFAALFIDARAEISIVESRVNTCGAQHRSAPRGPDVGLVPFDSYLGASLRRFGVSAVPHRGPLQTGGPTAGTAVSRRLRPPLISQVLRIARYNFGLDNDPSAGSPTETLLRLLLPLNDKVQWTSRSVAGGEPPASQRSEHFTGPFNR